MSSPSRTIHTITGLRSVPSRRRPAMCISSMLAIWASSSGDHVFMRVLPLSGADQNLEGLAIGHGAVAVGCLVEADGAVEDAAGFDGAVEDVGHEFLDVGAGRCGSAGEGEIADHGVETHWYVGVLGYAGWAGHA